MASFYTTVSRLGQLAGGLDVAQKEREKAIAAKNEQIRQFNLGLQKDYDIARERIKSADARNYASNLATVTAAKIRSGGKNSLGLSDFSNLGNVIEQGIMNSGVINKDYFQDDGTIGKDYMDSLSGLKGIIQDEIISKGIGSNDLAGINQVIQDVYKRYQPSIAQDGGALSFNNPQLMNDIKDLQERYLQAPKSNQRALLDAYRIDLYKKLGSVSAVNQILRIIQGAYLGNK